MTKIYCEGYVVQLQRVASKFSGIYDGFCLVVSETQEEPPFKIIDGRNDRTRSIDREIEAWKQARQAWVEFGFSVDPETGVVKRYD